MPSGGRSVKIQYNIESTHPNQGVFVMFIEPTRLRNTVILACRSQNGQNAKIRAFLRPQLRNSTQYQINHIILWSKRHCERGVFRCEAPVKSPSEPLEGQVELRCEAPKRDKRVVCRGTKRRNDTSEQFVPSALTSLQPYQASRGLRPLSGLQPPLAYSTQAPFFDVNWEKWRKIFSPAH